jgi:serine/threonine protein kinase
MAEAPNRPVSQDGAGATARGDAAPPLPPTLHLDDLFEGADAPNDGTGSGNRFQKLDLLAQGGLGRVSIAIDAQLKRKVALKEIRGDRRGEVVRRRFLAEAEITGQLEHPGIVPIYALERDAQGEPYYAMRLIQGTTLGDAIRDHHAAPTPLRFRELLQRFVSVCQTIAYAHSKNVIHRDLKPANVMLGAYGETLVVDWGLAKRLDSDSGVGFNLAMREDSGKPGAEAAADATWVASPTGSTDPQGLTQPGDLLGTPAYMSPEQTLGRPEILGPASDVYSLGAMLYEILAGQPPFLGDPMDVLVNVQDGLVNPPSVWRPVDQGLAAICLKAMAREPAARYATALELAREVERYLADEPPAAYREPLPRRCQRWLRRHRGVALGAAATLLVAMVSAAAGLVLVGGKNRELQRANARLTSEEEKTRAALAAEQARRRQAYALLDRLTSNLIGDTLATRRQFRLTNEQRQALEQALATYRELATFAGNDPGSRLAHARALWRVGELESRFGDHQRAAAALEQAVEEMKTLLGAPELEAEVLDALADAQGSLATVLLSQRKLKRALDLNQQAVQHRERLLEKDRSGQALGRMAQLLANFAWVLEDAGRLEEAKSLYEKCFDYSRAAIKANPGEAVPRQHHARILINYCSLLLVFHQDSQADRLLEEALGILNPLVQANPLDADLLHDAAMAQANRGVIAHVRRQFSEALERFRQARTSYEAALRLLPAEPGLRMGLAEVLHNCGVVSHDDGNLPAAAAALREGASVLQALLQASPNDLDARWLMARTLARLGEILGEQGERDQALAVRREGLRHLEAVAESGELPAFDRGVAAAHYFGLAELHQERGEDREAIVAYDKARAQLMRLNSESPERADPVFLAGALCNLAGHWQKLDPAKVPPLLDEAAELLEAVLSAKPANARARKFLANVWKRRADYYESINETEKAAAAQAKVDELRGKAKP